MVDYVEQAHHELNEFFKYMKQITNPDMLQAQEKLEISYMLNRIETWLILKLQDDFLKDHYRLASIEVLSFYIPIAIFLKKCKETLDIERGF